MKKILVTGGTGLLGKEVVTQLRTLNYEVDVLSSKENAKVSEGVGLIKGDLATNKGLTEATENADIIIHCASNPKDTQHVDIDGTRNLFNAINKDKTRHFIFISIINVDKSDYAYYQTKVTVEKMIAESGIPFSILRTTQFHNFVLTILQSFDKNNGQIIIPDGIRFQPIEVKEAAALLVELAQKDPAGLIPGIGGPEVLKFEEMVKIYLKTLHRNDEVKTEHLESEEYERYRSANNIWPFNIYGNITWEKFLKGHFNT
jgi:uncharacterized protein YbjT (DUF2867 family)